jgi:hypothetical protein
MPNIHEDPAALETLQDDIYRDRILRARAMTIEQRFEEIMDLSASQFGMMLAGAMHRLGTEDEEAGWREVTRWMKRLDGVRRKDFYVAERTGCE